MKKTVLNYLVILAVSAAFTSCKKEVVDAGVLTINGKEFPIIGAIMCESYGKLFISFDDKDGRNILSIGMNAEVSKIESKTYTASEVESLRITAFIVDGMQGSYNYIDDDVVMKVNVKGETYTITINGRATQYETEADYSFTYKGKITEEVCY